MRKLLENLMERAAVWPEEAQAELVESMIEIEVKHAGAYRLSDEERQAIRRSLQELRDGKIATAQQVAEVFDRYRLRHKQILKILGCSDPNSSDPVVLPDIGGLRSMKIARHSASEMRSGQQKQPRGL